MKRLSQVVGYELIDQSTLEFPVSNKKYVLLVMLDDPKVAKNLIYNYRGLKIRYNS